MSLRSPRLLATGLSAALLGCTVLAGPALAITPDEVWTGWQGMATKAGSKLTATAEKQGDDLVLRALTSTTSDSDAGVDTTTNYGDVTLKAAADGRVDILMPAPITMKASFKSAEAGEPPVELLSTFTREGEKAWVTGTAELPAYGYEAASLSIQSDAEMPDADTKTTDTLRNTIMTSALKANWQQGPGTRIATQVETGETRLTTNANIASEGAKLVVRGVMASFKGQFEGEMDEALAMAAPSIASMGALTGSSSHESGPMVLEVEATSPQQPLSLRFQAMGSSSKSTHQATGITYDAEIAGFGIGKGGSAEVSTAGLTSGGSTLRIDVDGKWPAGAAATKPSDTDPMGMAGASGTLKIALVGVEPLFAGLLSTGLVAQDDLMGVRMMMGMFAVPGDEGDSLKTTIELTPEGGIVANGMPLQ